MPLFRDIKCCIEAVINLPLFLRLLSAREGNVTWLLLSPQYVNFGDHLIALAELDYLRSAGCQATDANLTFFDNWGMSLQKRVKPGDVIWVTGGGYLGDVWPDSHASAMRVLELFPEQRIVFAPQTTYFEDSRSQTALAFAEQVKAHGGCVFFARDRNTVERLAALGIDSILAPDFGLLAQDSPRGRRDAYVGICLRADRERAGGPPEQDRLEGMVSRYRLPLRRIAMTRDHVEIPAWCRRPFVKRKLEEFANAALVVTDRLHGLVFSCIAGVPCVALDNRSRKVSGVYEWVRELDYVAVAESVGQLEQAAAQVMRYRDKEENRKQFQCLRRNLLDSCGRVFERYIIR